jgi:hypothetical protein
MDIAANGGAGAGIAGQGGTVVEDMYLTTKVGDVTVKAGNYALFLKGEKNEESFLYALCFVGYRSNGACSLYPRCYA